MGHYPPVELVGRCDIVTETYASGELVEVVAGRRAWELPRANVLGKYVSCWQLTSPETVPLPAIAPQTS
jgi:hypothetical protein